MDYDEDMDLVADSVETISNCTNLTSKESVVSSEDMAVSRELQLTSLDELGAVEERSPTEFVKKVSFSEEKPMVFSYYDDSLSNPLLRLLMDSFASQRDLEAFIRLSLTRIIGIVPGLTEYSFARYSKLWKRVIEEFHSGRIEEDIHVLITEIWPYISAPASISSNGTVSRTWRLQYFDELVNEFSYT